MAEDLQGLLNKIQTEGLQKAETQKNQIIQEAEAQAAQIIAQAEAQAAAIRKEADEYAASEENKANIAIRQAARDIVIALKADILKRLQDVVKQCAGEAMTPAVMAEMIKKMAEAYALQKDSEIEVILSPKDFSETARQLNAALLQNLKAEPVIHMGQNFSGGLQIGFKDQDVFLDFSDEALADIICEFVGPKLTAVIKN